MLNSYTNTTQLWDISTTMRNNTQLCDIKYLWDKFTSTRINITNVTTLGKKNKDNWKKVQNKHYPFSGDGKMQL